MVAIDANDIRIEVINHFTVICGQCGAGGVIIEIGGAEEYGDVGEIEMICTDCGHSEYATNTSVRRVSK